MKRSALLQSNSRFLPQILLLSLMVLLPFGGFAQQAPRSFLVLTNGDTLIGRVQAIAPTKKREGSFRVRTGEEWKRYAVTDVAALRMVNTDYILRHTLHSEFSLPYHQVLVVGKTKFYGQPCSSCPSWLSLHVEFEDGEVVCLDKDSYNQKVLPRMMESPAFKNASLSFDTRYPGTFVSSWIYRLSDIFTLYNQSLEADEAE